MEGFTDGQTTLEAWNIWDERTGGFMTANKVEHITYKMTGLFTVDEDGTYSFNVSRHHIRDSIKIDGYSLVVVYTCQYWRSYDVDKELTAGTHTIVIEGSASGKDNGFQDEGKYRFKIQMKKPNSEVFEPIIFYNNNSAFNPVYDLSFDSYYHTLPLTAYIQIPFKVKYGIATECYKSNGDLPDGLKIDTFKQSIVGYTTVVTSEPILLQMKCRNNDSVTNEVSLLLDVTDRYVEGVISYYMTITDSFDFQCSTKYTPSNSNTQTEIIRNENNINKPYHENPYIWDGLTPNFYEKYSVYWEGYLYVESTDTYMFKLTSAGGSWLDINYNEIINNKLCHGWESSENEVQLTKGYNFIQVYYSLYKGENGIEIKWKKENENEYYDLTGNIFYVPKGDFEYTYKYAVYITGKEIIPNIPFIYNNNNNNRIIKNCTFQPSLPSKLVVNSECVITGTPTQSQSLTEYKVIAEFDDGIKAETTLSIKVIDYTIPTGLKWIDTTTYRPVENLTLYLNDYYSFRAQVTTGKVIYYELSVIPDGFTFDKFTAALEGTAAELKDEMQLEVKAYYTGDLYVSLINYLSVRYMCDIEGERVHKISVESASSIFGEFSLSIKKTDSYEEIFNLYKYTYYENYFESEGFCLTPGKYIADIQDNRNYPVSSIILSFYVDGIVADTVIYNNPLKEQKNINTCIYLYILFIRYFKTRYFIK